MPQTSPTIWMSVNTLNTLMLILLMSQWYFFKKSETKKNKNIKKLFEQKWYTSS